MRTSARIVPAACLLLAMTAASLFGAEAAKATVLVDTYWPWRIFQSLKPPVIQQADKLLRVEVSLAWLNWDSPTPAGDWQKPDFDDGAWLRGPLTMATQTPYLDRLCLRNRFAVTDPAKVQGLSLTVSYRGGVAAYVNGQEIGRANLPAGAELAEGYSEEVFLSVEKPGAILGEGWTVKGKDKEIVSKRDRTATFAIPANLLRQGANVVAIELVRAPYGKAVAEHPFTVEKEVKARGTPYDLAWPTCRIVSATLQATGADGLEAMPQRPDQLQVWNGDTLLMDHGSDFGNPAEPLRPVAICGPRNGRFSGKVLVGSAQPIKGLKAVIGELKGPATIPAASVEIRYAAGLGDKFDPERGSFYPRDTTLLNALLDEPLPEFPVAAKFGAVVPIWITVQVPKDAAPGAYAGELKIAAEGQPALTVPVQLDVLAWTLPDLQDYRAWIEIIQSPEAVAMEYDAPLWSDQHWELVAKSLAVIGRTSSRVVYVPLICNTNSGNAESMVRWVKEGDKYSYDFSRMDKYLDLYAQHVGKPKFTVFNMWEVYLKPPAEQVQIKDDDSSYVKMEKSKAAARWELKDKGPAVTVVDPATQKAEPTYVLRYENPACKELWQPLWPQLRARMEQRGWTDTMVLGMLSDNWPGKDEAANLKEISGGLPWIMHSHGGSRVKPTIYGLADIVYTAYVWNCKYPSDPAKERTYGWKLPQLHTTYMRFEKINNCPGASLRHLTELNITGAQHGLGRIGGEFWPVLKDKQGRRTGTISDRYPESYWHSLNLRSSLLVPGPKHAVPASRMYMLWEGVQECEARIAIEQALTDEALKAKLGPDLAQRAQACLDLRLQYLWPALSGLQLGGASRYCAPAQTGSDSVGGGLAGHQFFASSGWQARTRQLYELAGEVAAKLK